MLLIYRCYYFFLPFENRRIYRTPTLSSTSLQTAINPVNLFCSWVVVVLFFLKMQMKCWLLFPVLVGIDLKRYFVQLTFIWRDSRCSLVGGFFLPIHALNAENCTSEKAYLWLYWHFSSSIDVEEDDEINRDKKLRCFPLLENRLNVWRTIYLN